MKKMNANLELINKYLQKVTINTVLDNVQHERHESDISAKKKPKEQNKSF